MKILHVSFRGKYGLSNRIRSMAGHYAFSKIRGFDFTYNWVYDESCPGLFSDVFEPVPGVQYLDNDIENTKLNLSEYIYVDSGSKPTNCGSPPEYIFNTLFHENTDLKTEFSKLVTEFYRLLRPTKRVLDISEETFSNFTDRNVLGIHVRRTDMLDHMKNIGMEPPTDDNLVHEIKNYLQSNRVDKIFVASDNPESLNLLKREFPGLVISQPHSWSPSKTDHANDSKIQARLTNLDDAVSDLFLLSKCKFIIGTKLSSFSVFASLWGNVSCKRV